MYAKNKNREGDKWEFSTLEVYLNINTKEKKHKLRESKLHSVGRQFNKKEGKGRWRNMWLAQGCPKTDKIWEQHVALNHNEKCNANEIPAD
jgi:hypothetical protein